MQVTEVTNEGLNRAYKVVVPADEIDKRVTERLSKLAKEVKVPGFRPGKAPLSLMKRQYGKSVLGEILEKAVDDGSRQAINDNNIKPALQPKIEVTSFDEGKDLEFSMAVEVLPEVPEVDVSAIALTRQTAPVGDDAVQDAIDRLVKSRQEFGDADDDRVAEDGDRVTLDFLGKIDGEPFDGGKAEDFPLVIGSKSMIPGFEEQVAGLKKGDEKTIDVTFPENYQAENLAGKGATFDLTIKSVEPPEAVTVDDAFAQEFNVDSLEELKNRIRESLTKDYANMGRAKLKRALLDHLAETVHFGVPEGMVEIEFNAIWKQLEDEMQRNGQTFDDAPKNEEETRAEYRAIAERRVRLGLVLSDIGSKNEVTVEQEELQNALMDQARRFPGQEKEVFEYYQKTPGALEQLRAPIFEDKVVDHIFDNAAITDEEVSLEELVRDPDDEADDAAKAGDEDKSEQAS